MLRRTTLGETDGEDEVIVARRWVVGDAGRRRFIFGEAGLVT